MFQQRTKSTKVEIVQTVTYGQMRLNNIALCHVHKAILDKLDIKKLMQEFGLRKGNRRSLFMKCNLMLIIQNVLLKWFDEWQKSTRSTASGGMAHGTGL